MYACLASARLPFSFLELAGWKDFRQSWKKHLCDAAGLNLPRFTPTARESFFTQELQNNSKLKPGKVPNKEFQRLWRTITKRWARKPGAQLEENDDEDAQDLSANVT